MVVTQFFLHPPIWLAWWTPCGAPHSQFCKLVAWLSKRVSSNTSALLLGLKLGFPALSWRGDAQPTCYVPLPSKQKATIALKQYRYLVFNDVSTCHPARRIIAVRCLCYCYYLFFSPCSNFISTFCHWRYFSAIISASIIVKTPCYWRQSPRLVTTPRSF
jgi:hypothetical protein